LEISPSTQTSPYSCSTSSRTWPTSSRTGQMRRVGRGSSKLRSSCRKTVAEHDLALRRAGSITSAMAWARSANISAISHIGASPLERESSTSARMRSPVAVPPGWRVMRAAVAALFQPCGQAVDLRGFTGTIQPFEGNKQTARMG
jgi:hypothetical protein